MYCEEAGRGQKEVTMVNWKDYHIHRKVSNSDVHPSPPNKRCGCTHQGRMYGCKKVLDAAKGMIKKKSAPSRR